VDHDCDLVRDRPALGVMGRDGVGRGLVEGDSAGPARVDRTDALVDGHSLCPERVPVQGSGPALSYGLWLCPEPHAEQDLDIGNRHLVVHHLHVQCLLGEDVAVPGEGQGIAPGRGVKEIPALAVGGRAPREAVTCQGDADTLDTTAVGSDPAFHELPVLGDEVPARVGGHEGVLDGRRDPMRQGLDNGHAVHRHIGDIQPRPVRCEGQVGGVPGLDGADDLQGVSVDGKDRPAGVVIAHMELLPVGAHGKVRIVGGSLYEVVPRVDDLVGGRVHDREHERGIGDGIQPGPVRAHLQVAHRRPGFCRLHGVEHLEARGIDDPDGAVREARDVDPRPIGFHGDAPGRRTDVHGPDRFMGFRIDGTQRFLPRRHRVENRAVRAHRDRGRVGRYGRGNRVRGRIDERDALLLGGDVDPVPVRAHVHAVRAVAGLDAPDDLVRADIYDRHVIAAAVGYVCAGLPGRLGVVDLHGHARRCRAARTGRRDGVGGGPGRAHLEGSRRVHHSYALVDGGALCVGRGPAQHGGLPGIDGIGRCRDAHRGPGDHLDGRSGRGRARRSLHREGIGRGRQGHHLQGASQGHLADAVVQGNARCVFGHPGQGGGLPLDDDRRLGSDRHGGRIENRDRGRVGDYPPGPGGRDGVGGGPCGRDGHGPGCRHDTDAMVHGHRLRAGRCPRQQGRLPGDNGCRVCRDVHGRRLVDHHGDRIRGRPARTGGGDGVGGGGAGVHGHGPRGVHRADAVVEGHGRGVPRGPDQGAGLTGQHCGRARREVDRGRHACLHRDRGGVCALSSPAVGDCKRHLVGPRGRVRVDRGAAGPARTVTEVPEERQRVAVRV